MHDYKTEAREEAHRDETRKRVAKALGISEKVLARHPYDLQDGQVLWSETVPKGMVAQSKVTTLTSDW